MFQSLKSHTTAITAALCLSLLATASYAQEAVAPAEQAQSAISSTPTEIKPSLIPDMSLADIRRGTKTKISDTRQWVADQKITQNLDALMTDMGNATDQLQDKVAPARHSLKSFLKDKIPGKSLMAKGEQSVTIFGILLILAFGFVVLMMSISGPASRLGGRH